MNLKNKKICKLCDGDLFKDPILVLNKMPKAAQHFLNRKELPNFESINLKIYQCKKCGLVQLISKPVWYFKDVITAATISGKVRKLRLKQMKSFSKKYNLFGKKIIEVGCASGEMLDIIEEAKMLGYGLEHSAKSVSKGLKIGRKINKGFIEDTNKFDNGPFDGFLCYNFLEHLPNLKKAIKNIYNNLYEGGVGIVTVPNLKYLLKTKTHYEFVADHLSYFTQETISKAFNNLGFKILENILINNNNDIQIIVKKVLNNKKKKNKSIKKLNLFSDYRRVETLIKSLKSLSKDYKLKKKKIAVWGAGHRTLALLALSKLKNIEYIIDSAKFKQGKYSPVNNSKIVSPNELLKKKVNLVIVMLPGIYPDEVIKNLKKMKINLELAKLKDNKIEFI